MRRGGFSWRSVLAIVSIGIVVGLAGGNVIPARAAPPNQTVTIGNTPLPVTGQVTIGGTTAITGTVVAAQALPSEPFGRTVDIAPDEVRAVVGPFAGSLGVGSIMITNFDFSTTVQMHISGAIMSGGTSCETATFLGGSTPELDVLVGPRQTVHLPYPTPLVFPALNGAPTCVLLLPASIRTGTIQVSLTGSVQ